MGSLVSFLFIVIWSLFLVWSLTCNNLLFYYVLFCPTTTSHHLKFLLIAMATTGLIILKHCLSILCCRSLHVDFHFRCFQVHYILYIRILFFLLCVCWIWSFFLGKFTIICTMNLIFFIYTRILLYLRCLICCNC